jgi:glycosyltransferase involved in cell wall biosynthesis
MAAMIVRVPDIGLAGLLGLGFGLHLLWLRCFRRNTPLRPVLASMTQSSVRQTLENNSLDYVARFYDRPSLSASIMLHTGATTARVTRIGPRVVGVDCTAGRPRIWRSWLPITARSLEEMMSLYATLSICRRHRIGIVEVMSPGALVPRAILIRFLMPLKLVSQVRGNSDLLNFNIESYIYCRIPKKLMKILPIRLLASAIHRSVAETFFRSCDLVIGLNWNNMQNAISNGADPGRTRLSRIQIDRHILVAPHRDRDDLFGLPPSGRLVTLWSRLSPEKRVREAVDAFLILARTVPDVVLVVIGDGSERGALEAQVAAARQTERVHFLGFRDRDTIGAIVRHSAVTLHTYAGSTLVEAALLEAPIVAFDIEWHGELVRDGETGWLVDFPDVEAMAAALDEALDQPKIAANRAGVCRLVAERMFDPDAIARREAALYARLAQSLVP